MYPYLYNTQGEWIGWVTPQREVYSILGVFVGRLSNDPRILGKRVEVIGEDSDFETGRI